MSKIEKVVLGTASISVLFGVLLILAVVVGSLGGVSAARGESAYTGQVVDLENERGLVFQTTQVHLKTDSQASSSEVFCVHPDSRDEHFDELREAASSGDRVTITYSRPYVVPIWQCQSGTSIVRDVETHGG